MKKKVISIMLSAVMAAALLAGCGSSSSTTTTDTSSSETETAAEETASEETTEAAAEAASEAGEEAASDAVAASGDATGKTFAIVVKSAGNPYNEKEIEGFQAVIEAAGGTCVVKEPEAATADAQVSAIQSLISQGVDSISIAANDENALQSALQEAMDAGIQVSCFDSKVNASSRATFVNQAGTQEIGQTLMDAVYDITGGSGQWAILSATSQATNQNAWIDAMKSIAASDEKYADLELVEVAYGDDEPQKSTDQTQALLSNYPDLKVICAPTTVGIAAAAKVLQDQGSSVKLTGLGLPSEMAEYIGDDDAHSCPYMYLWNPIDLGQLAAYTSIALVNGDITGTAGDSFTAGDMGDYTVVEADDGGTEIILGAPFRFDSSNIDEWKDIY
ncbi:MAG: rhamnose ABC transporter substrate-binding protein [Eubacteriales bacterium]|nr:rhamnose ABC transporter substrate-binding protein [Eubacteriales bacterium]